MWCMHIRYTVHMSMQLRCVAQTILNKIPITIYWIWFCFPSILHDSIVITLMVSICLHSMKFGPLVVRWLNHMRSCIFVSVECALSSPIFIWFNRWIKENFRIFIGSNIQNEQCAKFTANQSIHKYIIKSIWCQLCVTNG